MAGTVSAAIIPVDNENLVLNGDFDSETVGSLPDGWSKHSTVTAAVTDTTSYSGSNSLQIDYDTDKFTRYTVVLEPGKADGTYHAEFVFSCSVDPTVNDSASSIRSPRLHFWNTSNAQALISGDGSLSSLGTVNGKDWYQVGWDYDTADFGWGETEQLKKIEFDLFYPYGGSVSSGVTAWVDDVQLVKTSAVPEPSAFILCMFGAGVLLLVRRRR